MEKQYVLHILSVFVALVIEHAMRMRLSHLWPVRLYKVVHIFSLTTRFSRKKVT
jgi:hypothetical protein